MNQIIENIRDPNLKLCLAFGLGLHHAGLQDRDRRVVEELFVNQHIQVIKHYYIFLMLSIIII